MMMSVERDTDTYAHSEHLTRLQRVACRQMKTLTRRKKREFEEALELDLFQLLMSRDSEVAWHRLQEPGPSTPIEDPQRWHNYAQRLYEIPRQPPIPEPTGPRPATSTFFRAGMVEETIRRLQHGRSTNHTAMQSEHIIYAADTLAPFIAMLFNRALA
ncbi:hypothetical protein L7F22_057608 [Adiantum nelumboides]|nr:hypothetical protein [Adiantum nelumboides]